MKVILRRDVENLGSMGDLVNVKDGYARNFLIPRDLAYYASESAIKKLESYYWPGNIRQLINVIQRAIILCDTNKIYAEQIILEDEQSLENFNGTLEEFEILLLKKRLEQFNGNRTLTAKSLDVSVRWIQLKLKELGIQ